MTFSQRINEIAIEVLCDILAPDNDERDIAPEVLWERVAFMAAGRNLGPRRRDALQRATETAAVYLFVFLPPDNWTADEEVDEADLTWRSNDGDVMCDVIIPVGGSEHRVWTKRTRGRPRRLVATGRQQHGAAFRGVRMIAPLYPARSLLVTDRAMAEPALLASTDLWFAAPILSPDNLSAAAVGGAA